MQLLDDLGGEEYIEKLKKKKKRKRLLAFFE